MKAWGESGVSFILSRVVMSGPTIDLLSNHIYQQMVQIVYFDRCMVKWAGMLLSEHNEQMKDQEGYSDGAR